jgi:hypothetical protein
MMSAGMPMPVALASMPMPSYAADNKYKIIQIILLTVFPFLYHTIEPKIWHALKDYV